MTLVVAHRGAATVAPENTMEAYRRAVEMGADAIKLDVQLTADGELALMHDETVERTTDLTGPIATMTLKQLRAADAGFRFEAPDGTGLVVEVKARAATAPTIEALRGSRVRAAGAVSLISFEEAIIDEARGLDPEIPTGYLLVPSQPIEAALTYAVEHGHAAVHPYEGDLGLDPGPILSLATAYGRLMGCYVVNDPARMQQLAAYGLWGFVTDVPEVGRQALGARVSQ